MSQTRHVAIAALLLTISAAPVSAQKAKPAQPASGGLSACVQSYWPLAQARGVSRANFDTALQGITQDASIIALTKKQAEFSKPVWSYIAGAVSAGRVSTGQSRANEFASILASVESRFGGDKRAIMGIWGMETSYGSFTGDKGVFRSLATLACAKYRGEFFRDELISALAILEEGHVPARAMRGSWAGAMGHTQFMPSSFMKWAVDHNGDGAKDIWNSIPDALASTGNYLAKHGWVAGLPWGMEVELPAGFDFKLADRTQMRAFGEWARLGLQAADGSGLSRRGDAALFLPAGARGPAFLITKNFAVIKAYNNSDAYALGVAHLGDRIFGGGGIQGDWPTGEKQLSKTQRFDIQKRLTALGHYKGEVDGRLGEGTRQAIRAFQLQANLTADGYPTAVLHQSLMRGARN